MMVTRQKKTYSKEQLTLFLEPWSNAAVTYYQQQTNSNVLNVCEVGIHSVLTFPCLTM